MQHHIFVIAIGGLYQSPLKDLQGGVHRVLDIGTGTGIWALDLGAPFLLFFQARPNKAAADEFPSADVLGVDLSPIQPQ